MEGETETEYHDDIDVNNWLGGRIRCCDDFKMNVESFIYEIIPKPRGGVAEPVGATSHGVC